MSTLDKSSDTILQERIAIEGKIVVKISNDKHYPDNVRVSVRDKGPGIPPQIITEI